MAIDADQVAQFVTDRSRAGQITLPPIDEVLEAWISCANQLGHASLKRLPFVPHDDIRPVMDALAALGYAKPLDNAFHMNGQDRPRDADERLLGREQPVA